MPQAQDILSEWLRFTLRSFAGDLVGQTHRSALVRWQSHLSWNPTNSKAFRVDSPAKSPVPLDQKGVSIPLILYSSKGPIDGGKARTRVIAHLTNIPSQPQLKLK